jgi:hypothetical protein
MADLNEAASTPAPEETSLHDELASAFDKASKPDEPVPETQEEEVQVEEKEFAADKAARERDEKGRFSAKEPKEAKPEEEEAPEATEASTEEKLVPPTSWSATAKAAFKDLPKAVQQAVVKRDAEIVQGQETYRKTIESYKELDPYVEMAERSGTNLPEALRRYVSAEQLLERDPISGLKWLIQNYNVDPRQLLPDNLSSSAPQQMQQPTQADPTQILSPVMERLNQIEQAFQNEREAKVAHEIDAFFNDTNNHPYAENVADQMAIFLKNGQAEDLKNAYDKACWLHPEIRGLLINEQQSKKLASQAAKAKATASQARVAGNSITGGPQSAIQQQGSPVAEDLRAQIEAAFNAGRA